MRRKWVILTCVVYAIAGVWSLPVENNPPVSVGIPANVSSSVNAGSDASAGISKPPVATSAVDPKGTVSAAASAVKLLTENKTLGSEADVTDAGNATVAGGDKKESDAPKVSQPTVAVVQDGQRDESVKNVSESDSPKSETAASSDLETQNPESRKASVQASAIGAAAEKPADVSQKPEDKDIQTKEPETVPPPQESSIVAEAGKTGASGAAESEGSENAEVKTYPPAEETQEPKPDATVAVDANAETKPRVTVQPPLMPETSKPDDLPQSVAGDAGSIAFGNDVSGGESSMAGSGAEYSESYSSVGEQDYDGGSNGKEVPRDGLPMINNAGQFTDDADSHFFAYFLTIMVTAIIFYLVFHNKQRIIALIIEGRAPRNGRTRRASSRAKYHKLDNNLEEAITATKGTNGC